MMRLLILVLALSAGSLSAQQGWRLETANAPWPPRSDHASVVFDNKLWIMFGDSWATVDGINWSSQGSSDAPAGNALELNGELWGSPATAMSGFQSSVWRSPDGINWIQELDAPWPDRSRCASVVFNGKLWIFGGQTRQAPYIFALNDVWSSPDGVNWTQEVAAAAWSARVMHTATVFNNRMWIIGGGWSQTQSDVWSSADGVNWVQETANAPWGPRARHAAVVYRDRLWVIGGQYEEVYYGNVTNIVCYSDAWSSADGVNWVRETGGAPWRARIGLAAVVYKNRIWLSGGILCGVGLRNDVWSYGLHIAPGELPVGYVGETYNVTLEAREGDGPFDWTLLSSQLPPGMTLDTTTTSDSVYLHGTPTETGDFPFTLQLEDADGNVIEQGYTLTVTSPPPKNSHSTGGGTGCTAAPAGLPWLILYGALTLIAAAILRRRAYPE